MSTVSYCIQIDGGIDSKISHSIALVEDLKAGSKTINEINSTVVTTKLVKRTTTFVLYPCHVSSDIIDALA